MSERPRVLVELGAELERAARRSVPAGNGSAWRAGFDRHRLRFRVLPVALLILLAGAAAAIAASLISSGAPVPPTHVFSTPDAGLGKIVPGGAHLLPISTPDPAGGPAWGMRVLKTTRGAGCIQVGRLVNGQLVALGQDDAFKDDGRAHELPLSAGVERLKCSLLDQRGDIYDNITLKSVVASAAPGEQCRAPGTYTQRSSFPTCPLADERNLYFGLLGPDAQSITYSIHGQSHTLALGPGGSYLLVTKGSTHRYTGTAGSNERKGLAIADVVPTYSPITSIQYRDGATCHLTTASKWIYGRFACNPPMREPFGYLDPKAPSHAQLATPVKVRVVQKWHTPALFVEFKSRVALSSLRGEYELRWHEAGKSPQDVAIGPLTTGPATADEGDMIPETRSVAAGQTIRDTVSMGLLHRLAHPRAATGEVLLSFHSGSLIDAEKDRVLVSVGHFTVTVP